MSDLRWNRRFAELRAHWKKHGRNSPLGDGALGGWATRQRSRRRAGRLSKARIRRLDSIGFTWTRRADPKPVKWRERMARLRAFRAKHGHCRVPFAHQDHELVRLVFYSRNLRRQDRLPAECIGELDALGFEWRLARKPSTEKIPRLRDFQEDPGRGLADFARRFRTRARQGSLPAPYIAQLNAMGFDWNPRETRWTRQMARLLSFHKEHGHCRVPYHYPDRGLVSFVRNVRARQQKRRLSPARIAQLDAIGFARSRWERSWIEGITRLRAFREKHGHCRVPIRDSDRTLACFVSRTRKLRRQGILSVECIAQLDLIGFDDKPPGERWIRAMARLRAYHDEHGHCRVRSTDPDRFLANLTAHLRSRRRHGKLSAAQIAELDALGLDWNPLEDNWRRDMAGLLAFRRKHGHCRVPSVYRVRRLAHFVLSARARKRLGTLPARRIAELDAIGFSWLGAPRSIGRRDDGWGDAPTPVH